jgi:ribosome-associated protein
LESDIVVAEPEDSEVARVAIGRGYDNQPSAGSSLSMRSPPPSAASDLQDTATARPSKTQLKKAMHDLQHLGEGLTQLSDARLAALSLPETLREAVREFQRTRSHEGRRRQMQYIGKLMRHADVEPIREAVAASRLGGARDALTLHEAEYWRDALLAGDDALTAWMSKHPSSDVQQLRSLVRAARKDAALPVAPGAAPRKSRAYRELFQFVRDHG